MAEQIIDESIFDTVASSLETNVKEIVGCLTKEISSLQNSLTNANYMILSEDTYPEKISKYFSSLKKIVFNKFGIGKQESFYEVSSKYCKRFYWMITDNLVQYGWHILFGVFVAAVVWTNIKPKIDRWRYNRRYANQNIDPVTLAGRHEAMELARIKMQERHDSEAALHKERLIDRAASKLSQIPKLEKFQPKGSLRPEVSPLTRDYCGPSYRPSRTNFNSSSG